MKTLYLLRHAHAENANRLLPMADHERGLTAAGAAAAARTAGVLAAFPRMDQVLCSTARRTRETARIVSGLPDDVIQTDRALYLAASGVLLEAIRAVPDSVEALLVVAHNPGIFALAHELGSGALADHIQDYSPATLTVFRVEGGWQDLCPAAARLETAFSP